MKNFIVNTIIFYRKYLSTFKIQCCRFHPSCSEYAIDAITKYGVLPGIWRSVKRIFRCHPFTAGGYDPA